MLTSRGMVAKVSGWTAGSGSLSVALAALAVVVLAGGASAANRGDAAR